MARASNDGVESILILRLGGSLGVLGCQGVLRPFEKPQSQDKLHPLRASIGGITGALFAGNMYQKMMKELAQR
jgi:hypothetical protein